MRCSLYVSIACRRACACLRAVFCAWIATHVEQALYCGRIPTNWMWWVINASALVVTTVIGEYLCLRRELSAIPVTKRNSQNV